MDESTSLRLGHTRSVARKLGVSNRIVFGSDMVIRARKYIEANQDAMVRIAEALLEREVLDGSEVTQLIRGETLSAFRSTSKQTKSDDDKVAPPSSLGGLRIPPLADGPSPA